MSKKYYLPWEELELNWENINTNWEDLFYFLPGSLSYSKDNPWNKPWNKPEWRTLSDEDKRNILKQQKGSK